MSKQNLCIYLLFILILPITSGQEILVPGNIIPLNKNSTSNLKKNATIFLSIPFFDDFSYRSNRPSSQLWADNNVYVNTHFGVNTVSLGVATFDILDNNGELYAQANSATFFGADTLTSHVINIAELKVADSVYLSFYYQPGGYGDFPEKGDSLKVQFFSQKTGDWQTVWKIPGPSTDTVIPPFKIAMILLNNPAWFDSIFKFRFINIASNPVLNQMQKGKRTNGDLWHIDYVYLNKNRKYDDTSYNDVAIIEPLESFLKNYRNIPWLHYKNKYFLAINDKIHLRIFNHSISATAVEDKIIVHDVYSNTEEEPINSAIDIEGRHFSSFEENCPILKSDLPDSALFKIVSAITTGKYDKKSNDTVVNFQLFKNFYAYDDGTAEFGYGLTGNNIVGGWFATRFPIYQPDSLIAVDLYFNKTYNDDNIAYFNLWVWNNKNSQPGDSIGGRSECKTISGGWIRYYLQKPIKVSDTLFVGLQQIDETFLNIGYDRNSPNNQNILYNIDGNWTLSSLKQKGSLMIRPVFGKRSDMKIIYNKAVKDNFIFPNPTHNILILSFPDKEKYYRGTLSIYNSLGKCILHQKVYNKQKIDVNSLSRGHYLVRLTFENGTIYYTNLIKMP